MSLRRRLRKLEGRVGARESGPAPIDPDEAVEAVRVMLATKDVELTREIEEVVRGWAADPLGRDGERADEWTGKFLRALPGGPEREGDRDSGPGLSARHQKESPIRPVQDEEHAADPRAGREIDRAGGRERNRPTAERAGEAADEQDDPAAPLRRRPWYL